MNDPHVLKWLSICGRSEWDEKRGRVAAIYGAVKDITERKRSEEALRASEQIIEAILDSIPAGVFWKDTNLAFMGCNTTFARDAGFEDQRDVIGKNDYEIGCPKERADYYRSIDRQVIESGAALTNVEDSVTQKDGLATHLTTVVPLRNLEGEISGVLGTYVDITERKLAEEALKESEEKFRSITEQSADGIVVTNENGAIVEWNKAQETLTGLKRSEVIGLAAWDAEGLLMPKDLNIPEQTARIQEKVKGLLRGDKSFPTNERIEHPIILSDGSTRIVSEHIFVIKKSGGNMIVSILSDITEKGLTQQLLTFSKGGEPIRTLVPVAPLIRETCAFALSGANVKCTYGIAKGLWHCNIDRNQIGQVIQNLMLNAIQAMPLGGLIDVRAENVSLEEKERPLVAKGDYVLDRNQGQWDGHFKGNAPSYL